MSTILDVKCDNKKAYEIVIESSLSLFSDSFERIGKTYSNVCIITDSGVEKYYLDNIEKIFSKELDKKIFHFVFEQGENSKNLDTVQNIYKFLVDNNFTGGEEIWTSANQTFPQWVSFDLGEQIKIAELRIYPTVYPWHARAPKDFIVQGSNNGTTWEDIKEFAGINDWQSGTPKSFDLR